MSVDFQLPGLRGIAAFALAACAAPVMALEAPLLADTTLQTQPSVSAGPLPGSAQTLAVGNGADRAMGKEHDCLAL